MELQTTDNLIFLIRNAAVRGQLAKNNTGIDNEILHASSGILSHVLDSLMVEGS